MDPTSNTLTTALLESYDTVVLSELFRLASSAEASALANWVNSGGLFFGMSGWDNGQAEVDFTNSYLADFDGSPSYQCAPTGDCTVSGCSSFYPDQPLLAGIAGCDIDFVGGYPSGYAVSFNATGEQASYLMTSATPPGYNLGLVVNTCGPKHPRGGRYVLWGDEWISYTPRFLIEKGDEQIWLNIVNYLGICTSQCNVDSDCNSGATSTCNVKACVNGVCQSCNSQSCGVYQAANTCDGVTFHTSGNTAQIAFTSTVSTC